MFWLGPLGRRKIGKLDAQVAALNERLDKLHEEFRMLDLEMTNQVDRLAGIAKRFTGRKGGRPRETNGEADAEAEGNAQLGFSRHVL